jgi:anti-anti-sigma factor
MSNGTTHLDDARFVVSIDHDGATVVVRGDLDVFGAAVLSGIVDALIGASISRVTLNASEVSFMCGAAAGAMVAADKQLSALDGVLDVVDASPRVRRLLELTGDVWLLDRRVRSGSRSVPRSHDACCGKETDHPRTACNAQANGRRVTTYPARSWPASGTTPPSR